MRKATKAFIENALDMSIADECEYLDLEDTELLDLKVAFDRELKEIDQILKVRLEQSNRDLPDNYEDEIEEYEDLVSRAQSNGMA